MAFTYSCLDYQTAWYSGKDYESGLWGWSLLIYAWVTGHFDWSNPIHCVAFYFAIVAMPFGVGGNFANIYLHVNRNPRYALVYQIISFLSVFGMIGPGWYLYNLWDWSDPLSRYVAMVTVIDTIIEVANYGICIANLLLKYYVWPVSYPIIPKGKWAWEWLNYEGMWLSGKAFQQSAWGWCEYGRAAASTSFHGTAPQIMGIVFTLFQIFWILSNLPEPNKDNARRFARNNQLRGGLVAILLSCAGFITAIDGWDLSDSLTFYTMISSFDCLLKALFFYVVHRAINNGRFV